MQKTENLPPWRDCDTDWDSAFDKHINEHRTLPLLILKNAEIYRDAAVLKQKNIHGEWETVSWTEFAERFTAVSRALIDMGIQPGDMCSVFSGNCAEWAVADMGICATRAVSVPIYATNSKEEAEYIINDAEVKVVFAGNQEQYDKALQVLSDSKYLKYIVAMQENINISGDGSIYMSALIEKGKSISDDQGFAERKETASPEDMITIIYTSGTTGNPKGAVHTNRSFMNGIFTAWRYPEAGPHCLSMSILPLSHIFERLWSYGCMTAGVQIGYCPEPTEFVEYMSVLQPHFMTSVPRIWDKVYGAIHEGMKEAGGLKYRLFEWAQRVGLEAYRKDSYGLKYKIADKIIFSKIRNKLGTENCNVYHIGGSAFAPDVNDFFQAMGINIFMGYGLTEFFPVCVGFRDNAKSGYCGCLLPMADARISEEGEVQLKGSMAMKEYYKNREATEAAFTSDGWFRTGDVGELVFEEKDGDRLGYIKITDRLKELIITSGGKNISPQQIESLLGNEMYISQFVAIGEGRKFISALVVPNFVLLEDHCRKTGIEYTSPEEIIKNPEIIKFYEKLIEDKTQTLGQVEKIKKFILLPDELTQEAGELTPTLKLKRRYIDKKYKDQIDRLYE